ncbi:hypothetical protein B0O99DRAFT_691160 [Bisporella sp. PMI_857]|nr:hypothetical protein B0O99DRAFT_691160 [Bisporella sp. PMI_857]
MHRRQGPGGAGGSPGGGNGGQFGNPDTIVTTSEQQNNPTTTTAIFSPPTSSSFVTSTTVTESLTSSSTSSSSTSAATSSSNSTQSSSSGNNAAIIGGVAGGAAFIAILALIIFCLMRRKKKTPREKSGAESVTYAGLNESLPGVPFGHAHAAPTTPGGRSSGDFFLPQTYNQSSIATGGVSPIEPLNTSYRNETPSEGSISPISAHYPGELPRISGYSASHAVPPLFSGTITIPPPPAAYRESLILPSPTGYSEVSGISALPTGQRTFHIRSRSHDTMGFPITPGLQSPMQTSPEVPLISATQTTPIVSPMPHYVVHQDSLERIVRDGVVSPEPSLLSPVSRASTLRESGVLGEGNMVRIQEPPASLDRGDVTRNASRRTVDTVSSMGMSVISNTELERLGIGANRRYGN